MIDQAAPSARHFTLCTLLALGLFGVWWVVLAAAQSTAAQFLPALELAGVGGIWLLLAAARGERRVLFGILVFATVALGISFRVREQGAAGLDWQNGLKAVLWLGLLAISALNWRVIWRVCADPSMLAWLSFAGLCVLSTLYSPVPLFTAMSAISVLAYLGFACLLAQTAPARSIWLTMVWALALYILLNDLSVLVVPDIAFSDGRLQGISGHPNSLSRQTSLFLLAVFGAYYRRDLPRTWSAVLFALGVATLLATQSRTPIISIVIASVVCLERRVRMVVLPGLMLTGALLTFGGFTDTLLSSVGREGDAGDALTMAGRTELWQFVLHQIAQAPLLGHGFNSFESIATPLWYGQPDAARATHNNYLEVLFSIGIIGFIPFIIGVGVLLYRWIREPYPPRDVFVVTLVIGSFSEVDITTIAVMPTLVFFIIVTLDAARRLGVAPPDSSALMPAAAGEMRYA